MEFRLEISITNLLIFFNVLMFGLAALVSGSGLNISYDALKYLGAADYELITKGEVWRLLTASFLHANYLHIFVNMYALYSLGHVFEKVLGGKKLFVLYILSGIGGSLLSLAFNFLKVASGIQSAAQISASVGASGALFGILGFFVVTKDILLDKRQLYMMLLLNLCIGIIFAGVIDNFAHIGGFLTGIAIGLFNNVYQYKASKLPSLAFASSALLFVLSYLSLFGYSLYIILYK